MSFHLPTYRMEAWVQNASRLREAMSEGKPIRDVSVNPINGSLESNTGFLRAERELLMDHGWVYRRKRGVGIRQANEGDLMFRTIATDRRHLDFTEQVLSSFDFLTKQYNFRLVKTEPTFVRYESSTVFVNLYHGRASYELGFEIGRLDDGTGKEEPPYTLSMIMELMGAQEPSFFQASTAENVKKFVPKIADLVRTYAPAVLVGDAPTFRKLIKTRLEMANRLHEELRVRTVREKAATAWRSRDFVKAAELYNPIFENLTPAEIKKLNYAKEHLP